MSTNNDFARFARANALRAQVEREQELTTIVQDSESDDDENSIADVNGSRGSTPPQSDTFAEAATAMNQRQKDLIAALDNAKINPSNGSRFSVDDAPIEFDRRKSRGERVHWRVLNFTREPIHRFEDDDDEDEYSAGARKNDFRRPKGADGEDDDADALLYDEHEDSDNEKWANEQKAAAAAAAATDDATDVEADERRWDGGALVCPACFSVVCHASRDMSATTTSSSSSSFKIRIQYRARAVVGCTVSRTEVLRSLDDDGVQELFAPITCDTCSTEVGLFSASDKALYLFHVLPPS